MTRWQAIQKKKAELKKQAFFDPTYDPTFKKIFQKTSNLVHFLNSVLHLEGMRRIVYVERLKPSIRLTICDKVPKLVCFDIHARTANGDFFDVEMQRASQEDFLDRIEFYSAMLSVNAKMALISEATKKHLKEHPYLMPKVYSIWICNFNVDFCNSCREEFALYRASDVGKPDALPIYPKKRYIIIDLTKYVPKRGNSPENEWIKLFKTMPYARRAPRCKDEIFAEIYECMRINKSTDKFITEVATNMVDRYEYNASMSYARRVGLERGLAEGRAEGRERGLAEGRAEGLEKGLVEGREKGLAEGHEKGLAEGRAEGRAEGLAKGEARGVARASKNASARISRMAKFLRANKVPNALITEMLAIK